MALKSRRPAAKCDEPIAVIGAACRFPGADGVEAFWDLLVSGKDAIGEVDAARWATRFFYHPKPSEPGKSYTWAAGLIEGIDRFEPGFFGISPREAMQMDPQQRILLQLVWHAFEDAGIAPSSMRASQTGVYIGASATEYSDLSLGDPAVGDGYFMTGNALSILANRISYVFDLRGPSLTIDTACSSSLVALHHACEAIRGGRIASAVVGGVNVLLTPYPFIGFCRAAMLSPHGRCFAFDARADGYVRAEGAGVVILKPLADAVADHDAIRAVVLATGSNSDGRTIGMALPSEAAQTALLQSIYHQSDIALDDLAFFEMHGTGTPAGDPVEAAAVGRALASGRRAPLPIGSVKTNIGHLEPASGMAGLLKAMLALDRGTVPASLHCETPNPKIDFAGLNLRLVRAPEPISIAPQRRLAGVNSFGFGGTNAHIVLSAPPARPRPADPTTLPPLVVSAATEASLRELSGRWRTSIAAAADDQLPGLLRGAARGRDHLGHRLAICSPDPHHIADALGRFEANQTAPEIITGSAVAEARLAFVFAGNGAQFPGMARATLRCNSRFRAAVAEVDKILAPQLGWSVLERIEAGADAVATARADIAQPLLFAIQVGIVNALRANGVIAGACLGHSVGEIAAAWAAGALSLAEAAHVVVIRSRSQQRTYRAGRMAALALGHDTAREFLTEIGSTAEIAAFNGPRSVTVSGASSEIERLASEAQQREIWCRTLDLEFAFHSRLMDSVRDELLTNLAGLTSRPPAAMLASTVTGTLVRDQQLDAEHWWRNIRSPVRFAEAAAALISEGYRIFVEIGPNPILQAYLTDGLRAAEVEGRVLPTLSRNDLDFDPFPRIAARCYVAGYDWPSAPVFDGHSDPRGLPLYPWQDQRFWLDKTVEAVEHHSPRFDHPLLGFREPGCTLRWLNHLDQHVLPWIADHTVEGTPIFPAAAIIEMALAAARSRSPDAVVLEVNDVEIRRPMPFEQGRMRELRTGVTSEDGDWELMSRARLSDEPMTQHAVGRIGASSYAPAPPAGYEAGAGESMDKAGLYRLAAMMGLDYGKRFRTVDRVDLVGADRLVVRLDASEIGEPLDAYLLHPALLDGALQGLLALLATHGPDWPQACFLPWRFGRVRLAAPFGRVVRWAQLRLTRVGVKSASADISLIDGSGDIIAELTDCWFQRVELGRQRSAGQRIFRTDLLASPVAAEKPDGALERTPLHLAQLAAKRADAAGRREEGALLEALVGAAACGLRHSLRDPFEPFTISELVESRQIHPASAGLAERLLRSLLRLGGAVKTNGEWRLADDIDLPNAGDIWRSLLADSPDLVAELALAGALLDSLPAMLDHGSAPWQSFASPMVVHLLQASPASAAGIDYLADALQAIAADWPRDRPLRLLEIGADSVVTRRLLQCLAKSRCSVSYLATSGEPEEVDSLSTLTHSYPGAAARHWTPAMGEIGRDDGQFDDHAQFDIVVAINTCARLQIDMAALTTVRELLAPGGLFLAVEPEPNTLWGIVFGQDDGHWLNNGVSEVTSLLRSPDEWQRELALAGFYATGGERLASGPWPIAAFWGSAPPDQQDATVASAAPGAILLIAPDTPLCDALSDRLRSAGHRVATARPGEPIAPLDSAGGQQDAPETVIFLATQSDSETTMAQRIVALARAAHQAAQCGAALWLVTSEAVQAAPSQTKTDLAGAGLWGLAGVLANELPRLSIRRIDLASAIGLSHQARLLAEEIASPTQETEIVLTPHGRYVPRLRQAMPLAFAASGESIRLASDATGGLHSLEWVPRASRPIAAGEIEIDVRAAGLNFRDVMWAMGLLPEEALIDGFAGPAFGLECSGIVRAIGAGVEGYAIGDRVMAFAPAALGTRVITLAEAAAPVPENISFEAAATLPVAFVTAIYALGNLAQLKPGEHVLIHAAAGGVGLAAIQYAKYCGAIVIATAGSPIKRSFLRLAGADHVFDSRDLAFADEVRELTCGTGVDVVLNSLSGEAMERSLEVLKPFGRFLELGKRDFFLNRRLHLRPFRKNISFYAVDVDQLPACRPDLARSLLSEISRLLGEGAIRPLAHRVFRFSQVADAFRLMQASGHIGKLVLVPDPEGEVPVRGKAHFTARKAGTYLVTGGIEGFGFETARWLAAHGAGSIALLSRRGADTPGAEERVATLTAMGADVRVYQGDAADREAMAAVLHQIRATQPPLTGVVHAAAAIADQLTADIEATSVAAIFRPKLDAALILDELTRDDPIELFLLYSSATTVLGAPGQGAYVAANTALEALARRRHAEGRPALAVAWGPIEDAGYLAQRPEVREALARRLGATPIPAAQALAALPAMLASGLPVVICAEPNWDAARRLLAVLASPRFSEIRGKHDRSPGDDAIAEVLCGLDPEAAQAVLRSIIAEEAARILRLPSSAVDASRPLAQMGMDSLMAIELRLALESRLHIDLPLVSIAEGTSVASIAARLTTALGPASAPAEIVALASRYESADAVLDPIVEPADASNAAAAG